MTDYDLSIHHNPDAHEWAKFFMKCNPEINIEEDVMVGWFSNAMMAMHDHVLGIKFINGDHMQYELDKENDS